MDGDAVEAVDPHKVWLVHVDGELDNVLGTNHPVAAGLGRLLQRGSHPVITLSFPRGYSSSEEAARAAMRLVQKLDILCEGVSLTV
jgi:hypothetical protein